MAKCFPKAASCSTVSFLFLLRTSDTRLRPPRILARSDGLSSSCSIRNFMASIGSGGSHFVMLLLIRLHQGDQYVQSIPHRRVRFGIPKFLDLLKRLPVVAFCL